jgi:transaldolase
MNPNTKALHQLGQSLWLDNITRRLLDDGTLANYITEQSITGLTSNPTIFEHAIGQGDDYDAAITKADHENPSNETIFFKLAIDDLRRAADLMHPAYVASGGIDGWVSLEVSPLLADDTDATIAAAAKLHAVAARDNLFIKIPGTTAGVAAIEESIFNGIPINVTLLFSREQYLAAAGAYMRGIERRIDAGLDPQVTSVASLFISRWDVAANKQTPTELHNRLGIAIARQSYRAYRELLASDRWQALAETGARPQRLLWASTGTKDPAASDTLYVEALAAPDTINTMPEKTLHAYADHGQATAPMAVDGDDADTVLQAFAKAGIDADALAARLQHEGAESFSASWQALLKGIEDKRAQLAEAAR